MQTLTPILLPSEADIVPTIWYKSTDGLFDATSNGNAVTADNAIVRRVEDQSGNNLHASHATGPTLKLNQQLGIEDGSSLDLAFNYPALRFLGNSTSLLTLPNMSAYTTGLSVIVWKFLSNTVTNYWDMGATDNGAIWWVSDNSIYETHGTNARRNTGAMPSYATWLNNFRIYSVQSQSNLLLTRLSGRPFYRNATNTVAFRAAPVFGKNIFTQYGNFDLLEYRFYETIPTQAQQDKIFKKLTKKYNLSAV